jgi:parvulin-like peptidyl-prolyl isomerase
MVYAEGKKLGLDRSEEVKQRIALMRRQLKTLRRKFIIDTLLARYRGLELTDAQLRAQYDDNPGMYSDARIRVWQIKAADPETAQAILAEVRAHPERFADVARKKSIDAATAKEGGDLGVIVEGERPLSFERVAFALQPGEISDVVATRTGLYIFMVTERTAGQRKPFKSVKETIRAQLANYMQFEGYAAKVAELKARAAMQLNDEAIARLNTVEGLPKGWRKQLRETAATP